jgi:hypothetical protein
MTTWRRKKRRDLEDGRGSDESGIGLWSPEIGKFMEINKYLES